MKFTANRDSEIPSSQLLGLQKYLHHHLKSEGKERRWGLQTAPSVGVLRHSGGAQSVDYNYIRVYMYLRFSCLELSQTESSIRVFSCKIISYAYSLL